MFPVNWYVSNISRVPVPTKCNTEFLFCTLFVKLMLLYNKQSIFFFYLLHHFEIVFGYTDGWKLGTAGNWIGTTPLLSWCTIVFWAIHIYESSGLFLELSSYTSPICSVLFKTYLEDQKGQRNTSKYQELRYWNLSWEVGFTNIMSSYCDMELHYWTKTIMRHIGIY